MENSDLKFYNIIYLLTVLLVVFIMVDDYILINLAAFSLFLFLIGVKSNWKFKYPKTIMVFMLLISLLLLQNLIVPSDYFDVRVSFKETSRFLVYILLIMVLANIKINSKFFYTIWSTIFFVVLIIAVFQFYKFNGVNDILVAIYGENVYFEIAEKYTSLSNFRAGSIFVNPNGYAKFILSFLAVFLCADFLSKKYRKVIQIVGIVLALILAGSRTGFLISIILIVCSYFINIYKIKLTPRKIISFIILISIILIIITGSNVEGLRFLQIEAGMDNSLNYKFKMFINILKDFQAHNTLIGLGSFETIWLVTTIDFDLGYLIAFYGVIGVILYLVMLYDIYKYRKDKKSNYYYLNRYLIIILILFGLSGGILFNLRIFSFLCLLLFVNIIGDNKDLSRSSSTLTKTSN